MRIASRWFTGPVCVEWESSRQYRGAMSWLPAAATHLVVEELLKDSRAVTHEIILEDGHVKVEAVHGEYGMV